MITLDRTDNAIIKHLLKNSRMTNKEIAKKTTYVESTIKRRIDSLVRKKVIKKFTIELDETFKDDFVLQIFVLICLDISCDHKSIIQTLGNTKGLKMIYQITGKYDFMLHIVSNSLFELRESLNVLKTTKEIKCIETMMVLGNIDPIVENNSSF